MSVTIERVTDTTEALAIRAQVFMVEQGVSLADEIDGADPDCMHWLLTDEIGPVATLRVTSLNEIAKIQRVAVLARARGTGLGARLMAHVLEDLKGMGFEIALLGAQTDALGFYQRLGFVAQGPVYDDAGIPHRDMLRRL